MNAIGCVGNRGGFLSNSYGPVNNAYENACRLGKIIQPLVGDGQCGDGHINRGDSLIIKPCAQGAAPEALGHIDICA